MIQNCLAQPPVCRGDGPLALVLDPTRELAQQIEKEEYLTDPVRVKVGKVSSPAANVAQFLVKVSDNEKNSNRIRKRKTKSFFTFGRVGSLSLARARAKSIVDCRCKCHLRQLVVDPAIEPGQAPVTRVPSFTFWPCMSGLIIKGDAGGMVFILAEGSQGFAECVRPKPRKSWPALHDIFRKSN